MATNFPASLDSLTNPTSSDSLNSPSHSAQHANVNDAVEALQAKVGVDSSAVTSSLDYKVAQLEAISHGKILQIVRATDSTDRTTTSQTFTDAGISVTITPQKSDSAIIIIWSFNVRPPNNYFVWTVITDSSNNSLVGNRGLNGSTNTTAGAWLVTQIAYDTPATTSATTYKGRWARENSGTATIFNSTWATGQMFAIEVSA
jgi:hypothetical protein